MIVINKSLDTSVAGEKAKGCFEDIKNRYELFANFDDVALLTQDSQDFSQAFSRIDHVPCSFSRSKTVGGLLARSAYLRWSYFVLKSFLWLVRHRRNIKILISENVDSPAPFVVSVLFGIPYVVYSRYDVGQQVKWINKRSVVGILILMEEKFVFKRVEKLWVTSPHLTSMARSFGRRKQTTLIPNWISYADTTHAAGSHRSDLAEGFRILFVGRLHPVKRVDLIIQALSILERRIPCVDLYLVGDGEEKDRIGKLVDSLDLTKRVHFLGYKERSAVFELMMNSNVLVLCSKIEGNPRVLIEAMMCKIPIVATNVSGIRDMVQHKKTGYLVSNDPEPEELASAVECMLKDKELSRTIVNGAYEFARNNFSEESALRKIRNDLCELLQR